nr:hypothetical protein [Tanacetum cinerariifolium]
MASLMFFGSVRLTLREKHCLDFEDRDLKCHVQVSSPNIVERGQNMSDKDNILKGVVDRMYACLTNQYDETMAPNVLVPVLETTVPQKEETFQVIIDVIKNSMCFKAFTISADVLKIFMQQFWYTIKKVQDTDSYEFILANKKCIVNAEVFRTILNICPRVEGVDFADVLDDETALTFLIDLGYMGLLNRHSNTFMDHMHQPWRTLAAIINMYLSEKTASNDKLRKIISNVHQIFNSSDSTQEEQRKRRVKNKVTLSADDNIISDDPDAALELAKSISQTEAEEAKAARKVHATHAKIVTGSAKKNSSGRSSKSVVIQDTPSTPKSKPAT